MYVQLTEAFGVSEANNLIQEGWELIQVLTTTQYNTTYIDQRDQSGNMTSYQRSDPSYDQIIYIMGRKKAGKTLYGQD